MRRIRNQQVKQREGKQAEILRNANNYKSRHEEKFANVAKPDLRFGDEVSADERMYSNYDHEPGRLNNSKSMYAHVKGRMFIWLLFSCRYYRL